ncbi:MAG: deoxyribodipyrimidine photo-lyase [Cellvibrionaceae bacterium]|jgi:deoxyribodipyrimidine photo-lyase
MNLVWLRNDLRLEDNPALYRASVKGEVCCVFAITPEQWQQHHDSPAKLLFIRTRLIALAEELQSKNIPLKLIKAKTYGDIPSSLLHLSESLGVTDLWFNCEYPLNEKRRDRDVVKTFTEVNIACHHYHGDVIQRPGSLLTQSGKIYKVYSPFARQWRKQVDDQLLELLPNPRKQEDTGIDSDQVAKLWEESGSFRADIWPSNTSRITEKLKRFIDNTVKDYKLLRDIPAINGTSALSPYLTCGALSSRQCIAAARKKIADWHDNAWVNELIWREFYRHLTDAYPHLSRSEDFKASKGPIPWEQNKSIWDAWCQGETGFPIVDAAMKQLVQTGWMHNRLRMIVAAFLTKLLLIDWRMGEQFFMQHLIDGDYASNNGGWQWAASTGADAAPYFRIFNPMRQSEKFDQEGKFIKKFLPNLERLDKKAIHNPNTQQRQQCEYPEPIIDYKFARQRALDGYASAMGKS